MNKNAAIAIGVAVILVVSLVGIVLVSTNTPAISSVTVGFYDADGNLIYETSSEPVIWPWAFISGESPVTSVKITITYVATPTGEGDVTDVSIGGNLHITIERRGEGATMRTVDYSLPVQTTLEGSFPVIEYTLTELIVPLDQEGKEHGWDLRFEATVTATAKVDGTTVTATPWIKEVPIEIDWLEPGLGVAGTIEGISL